MFWDREARSERARWRLEESIAQVDILVWFA